MQGLLEILTKEMGSKEGDPAAILVHTCDDGGKGIGEVIGAALAIPDAELPGNAFPQKKEKI